MSETSHTPGPWVPHVDEPSGSIFVAAGAWPHGSTICEIEHDPREGTRVANARLIAAAPDLLASIMNSDDEHWTPAMRAAMKKALGEDRPIPSTQGTER